MAHAFHSISRPVALIVALVGADLLCGCRMAPNVSSPEEAAATAAGLDQALVFRAEGGPVDEVGPMADLLSLDEALRRAVTTDPGLQASLARVRVVLAEARQARLWPNPVLNLALRWPQGGGSPFVEASLAQDVLALLTTPRRASAADHRLRQAAAEVVTVALDLAADVQERYASIQALEALLPVLERRRSLLEQLVELAGLRLAAGEGARPDLALLQAQRVELDVEIAAARQQQREERLRLARLLGQPSAPADWPLHSWSSPASAEDHESAWIAAALAHRPELHAAAWRLLALGDDLALAGFPFGQTGAGGPQAERDGEWSLGPELSISLPIFDVGQARRERARAEVIEARHELTRAQRGVVEDVRRAHASLVQAQANVRRLRDELIPLQHERRAQAEALFRFGERDATGLVFAEQDVRDAEAQAIEMERQATIALLRLRRAVGGAEAAAQVTPRHVNVR